MGNCPANRTRMTLGKTTDGANFVLDAVRKLGLDEFPVGKTSFEVNTEWIIIGKEIKRRYDAVVRGGFRSSDGDDLSVFYKFKSWSKVPPAKFEEQLLKDLSNPDITNLGQLKWVFDGAKNPADFKKKLIAAINGMTDDQLDQFSVKFGFDIDGGSELRASLIDNFDSIFILLLE